MSQNELIDAVRQLPPAEFQLFVAEVLDLRAERQSPRISAPEAELLQRINAGLPADLGRRCRELGDKRDAETLTPEEHAELLRFIEDIERRETDRVAALAELAAFRHVSLAAIADQLGIRAPAHA